MYTDIEEWTEIRLRVLNGKASKREILRETGMHWKTLEKILSHSEPPGYRMVVGASETEDRAFSGEDFGDSGERQGGTEEATSHSEADVRTHQGGRLPRKIHAGQKSVTVRREK